MTPDLAPLRELLERWGNQATVLRPFAPEVATAFEQLAAELETAIGTLDSATVTIEEAAALSGYSEAQLRRLVKNHSVPNVGTGREVRIRRGDLPRHAGQLAQRERAGTTLPRLHRSA